MHIGIKIGTVFKAQWIGCDPATYSAIIEPPSKIDAAYAIGEFVSTQSFRECCHIMVPELRELSLTWDILNDHTRGQKIGFIIGKYGIEVLAPVGIIKGVNKIKALKRANTMLTLENCVSSNAKRAIILEHSAAYVAKQETFFKSVKIHWDRQNKHIPGKHNYEIGKGKIILGESELETLIWQNAGKGQPIKGNWIEPGYRERVDLGKIIGEFAIELKEGGYQLVPTSKAIFHYAKDGFVHIVPSDPKALLY